MQTINRYSIEPLETPEHGYRYNVRELTSADGGQSFFYTGNGRFCRTKAEAQAYTENREGTPSARKG